MNRIITRIAFSFIMVFTIALGAHAQKNIVDIEFDIKDYENDTMILGFYFGSKTLVLDTLFANKKGKFRYQKDTLLEPGIYLTLFRPGNNFYQFMVNSEDQKFKLSGSFDGEALKPSGSKDNQLFYDYMNLITLKGQERARTLEAIEDAKSNNKDFSSLQKEIDAMDETVRSEMNKILSDHPNSMTAMLLKSNKGIDIPEFNAEGEELQYLRYNYYKSHYFDNVDLQNQAVIRSPFIDEKVTYFMDKLTVQHPDSLYESIAYLLNKMEGNKEMFQYYTSTFLNKYANANIIGYDAIYVKLIDNYYSKGKTSWVEQETLDKFEENADKLRPILIGKKAPAINFYKENGDELALYDLEAEYTVLIFWSHTCGHCKKAMPDLKEFYNKWNPKGVEILGVCTKHRSELKECFEFAKKEELPWLNVGDEFHKSKFRDVYNVVSTPRVFILDKDKEILLKRVPTEKLDEIMESLVKEMEMKRQQELNFQKQ